MDGGYVAVDQADGAGDQQLVAVAVDFDDVAILKHGDAGGGIAQGEEFGPGHAGEDGGQVDIEARSGFGGGLDVGDFDGCGATLLNPWLD